MSKRKRDPIYNSRPYQWLIKKEQEGVFNKGPSLDDSGIGKKLDSWIQPIVDKLKKRRGKRLKQSGQAGQKGK